MATLITAYLIGWAAVGMYVGWLAVQNARLARRLKDLETQAERNAAPVAHLMRRPPEPAADSEDVMVLHLLTMAALSVAGGYPMDGGHRIEGTVVNGSAGGTPLAGAEVVLRAGELGALLPVASTVADQNGRFVFDNLSAGPATIYLPGANWQGIHYPGPRLQLQPGMAPVQVKLTVFDAVASPSPLLAERHEIDIQVQPGVLEITETLLITNPTSTTYVGEPRGGPLPVTLSLGIPDGFERVTFHDEFHGRRFQVGDHCLVTDIAWQPGKRELRFTYRLPVEAGQQSLNRSLDLPCALLRVRVTGEKADQLACNLPRVAGPDSHTVVFESSGTTLAAGHKIELRFGSLPTPWIGSARWAALFVLASLILLTVGYRKLRSKPQGRKLRQPQRLSKRAA